MSNNPRIVVLKLKELIYTGIFVILGILLIILFVYMFKSDKDKNPPASSGEVNAQVEKNTFSTTETQTTYNAGVYTSSLTLNNSSLELEVCVDTHRINSISITNMDETVTTMYPLIENSINDLSNQIVNNQSLENITYTDDCKYTYMILLDAISATLDKAAKTAD
jgi:uncharacterized protein with FMN-binding domain